MSPVPGVVERYFQCMNTDDWEGLREVLAPDIEIRPVGLPPQRGLDTAIEFYRVLLSRFSEHDDRTERFLVAGDSVAVEIRFVGTTLQGDPVEFDAVDIFDLKDGRVQRVSIWYDTYGVRRQVTAR